MWSGLASSSLLLAALVGVAGLANTAWWTAVVSTPSIDFTSSITLWQKTTDKNIKARTPAGGSCFSSDECVGSTWCRVGDQRCWSYGDCQWQSTVKHLELDCSRMPKLEAQQSWADICNGNSEFGAEACGPMAAIRTLAIATAVLALIATPFAKNVDCSFVVVGLVCMGFSCGFSAAILALVVDLPGARVGGPGFVAHCCAIALLGLGAAATLKAREAFYRLAWEEQVKVKVVAGGATARDAQPEPSNAPYTLLGREQLGKGEAAGGKPDLGKAVKPADSAEDSDSSKPATPMELGAVELGRRAEEAEPPVAEAV